MDKLTANEPLVSVMVRPSRRASDLDEKTAATVVAEWIAPIRSEFGREFGRPWIENAFRCALRNNLIDVVGVVQAAYRGDELADAALRAVGAELMEKPSGRPGEAQILLYYQGAGLRALEKPKRGGVWHREWCRRVTICILVAMACDAFGVPATRNRESRRAKRSPSGCSLVAAALAQNKIFIEEKSIQTNLWEGLPGYLARASYAQDKSILSHLNQYSH